MQAQPASGQQFSNSHFAGRGCVRSISRGARTRPTPGFAQTCCAWSRRHSRAPGQNENCWRVAAVLILTAGDEATSLTLPKSQRILTSSLAERTGIPVEMRKPVFPVDFAFQRGSRARRRRRAVSVGISERIIRVRRSDSASLIRSYETRLRSFGRPSGLRRRSSRTPKS